MDGAQAENPLRLPVVVDLLQLLRRLAIEEDEQRRDLARLEDCLRRFEDVERPAYESWLRLELGPGLTRLEELSAELRARQMTAERVSELVEYEGLPPREALYRVRHAPPASEARAQVDARREEIEARRRAKLERKRAQRKQARRGQRATGATVGGGAGPGTVGEASRARLVEIYRGLARRLHPDSPTALRGLEPTRIRTIWAEVQAGYAARSLERLLALSAWLETIPMTEAGASATKSLGPPASRVHLLSFAERRERLRMLQRSCRALERHLTELTREPAWGFASAPVGSRRRLKKAAARRLEIELAQVGAALKEVVAFLASIGSPRPPRSTRGR